jgi:hypothetical protein
VTMPSRTFRVLFVLVTALSVAVPAGAGVGGKLASWSRRVLSRMFARTESTLLSESVAMAETRVGKLVEKHGDEVFQAIEKGGKNSIALIEQHGAPAIKILKVHGAAAIPTLESRGAVDLISRLGSNGDRAAIAMMRLPGIAQPLLEKYGESALPALLKVNTRSARQLAMIAKEGGALGEKSAFKRVLDVAGKYGDKAVTYIGRHKATLLAAAAAAAFLNDPEPFITGAKDITQIALANTARPVAEGVGDLLRGLAAPIELILALIISLAALRDFMRMQPWRATLGSATTSGLGVRNELLMVAPAPPPADPARAEVAPKGQPDDDQPR